MLLEYGFGMNENSKNVLGKFQNLLISCVVTGAYFMIVTFIFDITYELNDDVAIVNILSGRLGERSCFTYYLSSELGFILSSLYALIPAVPWYGLFISGIFVFGFFITTYILLKLNNDAFKKVLVVSLELIIFTALFLRYYILIHYTVAAAFIGAVGLFLLCVSKEKSKFERLFALICVLMSYLIRENVGFMLAPFVFTGILFLLIRDGKEHFKELLIFAVMYVGLLCSLLLINRLLPGGAEIKEYKEYNEVRTTLYDYAGIDNEDEKALNYYSQKGLNEGYVALYESYNILLDEENSLEKMEKFASYAEVKNPISLKRKLYNAVYAYYYRAVVEKTDTPVNYLIYTMYGISVVLALVLRKFRYLIPIAFTGLYRSAFFVFLYFRGRYPERVVVSLFMMELLLIFAIVYNMLVESDKCIFVCTVIVVICLFGILSYENMFKLDAEYKRITGINEVGEKLDSELLRNTDNYYFIDVFATVDNTEKAVKNWDCTVKNYSLMGGWIAKHPVVRKLYDKLGAANPAEALKDNKNVFIVTKENISPEKSRFEEWTGLKLELASRLTVTTNSNSIKKRRVQFNIYGAQ